VTEAKVDRSGGQLLEFFGPGLGQYFYATAGIYGVARAEFGVLRAYAYAYGGVAPKTRAGGAAWSHRRSDSGRRRRV